MSLPARFAIIGYGSAGRGIHSRLIREAGFLVTAIVTRDEGRKRAATEDWPAAAVYDEISELIAHPDDFDVIVIASPSGRHVAHAEQVIDAGLAFVIEKPLAPTALQASDIVDRAAKARVPFTVFQNRRWDAEQLTARRLIESGELGRVHTFERRWERWRPTPQQRWKENDPIAGGLLLDLGSHLVDSATDLFGRVESVYAEIRSLTTPTEDDVFMTLYHSPRADGSAVISRLWGGSLVGAPGPRTRILGDKAAYLVTQFEAEPTPYSRLDEAVEAEHQGWIARGDELTAVEPPSGGHVDFYHAVNDWLRDRGPVPVDPRDAVRTINVLDAARISAREGRRVSV